MSLTQKLTNVRNQFRASKPADIKAVLTYSVPKLRYRNGFLKTESRR